MNPTPLLLAALAMGSGDSSHVVVAPGESLRVVTAGAGEAVVLIPGLAGSAFGYRRIVAALVERGCRAVVIEPLGIGGSSRPKHADYSLTAQAGRIAAVLDTLDLGPAVLVAHSVAASIALRVAYRRPDRVRALVSIEGGAAEAVTSLGFRRLMKLAPVLKLAGSDLLASTITRALKAASADTSWIDDAVIKGYTAHAMADVAATYDAYRAMSRAEEPERLADRLGAVRIPVLVLLGATPHRSAPDPSEIALLTERLPALTVETVVGAGHYIHEERPEAVLAGIDRFLTMSRTANTAAATL